MSERIKTKIKKKNHYIPAEFILYGDTEECELVKLELFYEGTVLVAMAETYFEAMIKIREALEENNNQLICKGACESVYPSAMILTMGDGRLAYSLKLGQHARLTDLVDIFGDCNADECTSIEQQERFYYEWAMSPKGKK